MVEFPPMLISPPLVRPELWCHGARADEHIPAAARMLDGSIYLATLKRLRQEYCEATSRNTTAAQSTSCQELLVSNIFAPCEDVGS